METQNITFCFLVESKVLYTGNRHYKEIETWCSAHYPSLNIPYKKFKQYFDANYKKNYLYGIIDFTKGGWLYLVSPEWDPDLEFFRRVSSTIPNTNVPSEIYILRSSRVEIQYYPTSFTILVTKGGPVATKTPSNNTK